MQYMLNQNTADWVRDEMRRARPSPPARRNPGPRDLGDTIPPRPFQCRRSTDDNGAPIVLCYIPLQWEGQLYWRNAYALSPIPAIGNILVDWIDVTDIITAQGTLYIILTDEEASNPLSTEHWASGRYSYPDACWRFWDGSLDDRPPHMTAETHTAYAPVRIASFVDGHLRQEHLGPISTHFVPTDTEADLGRQFQSIERRESLEEARQLYQFDQDSRVSKSMIEDSIDAGRDVDIVLRYAYLRGQTLCQRIEYVSWQDMLDLIEEAADDILEDISDDLEDDLRDDHPCSDEGWDPEDPASYAESIVAFDPCDKNDDSGITGHFRRISLRYWVLGGNATNCYGYSIGDANQDEVISLHLRELKGAWQFNDVRIQSDAIFDGDIQFGGINFVGVEQVEVVTSVDFLNQSVTTKKIWALKE